MGMPSGIAAQLAIGKEATATPGTRVAPTHFMPFVQESLELKQPPIVSKDIGGGRRTEPGWTRGNRTIEGSMNFELKPESTGLLLEASIGLVASESGAGPFTRVFTPADLTSLTIQAGRPRFESVTPVVDPFDFLGCMINQWTMSFDATGDGNMVEYQAEVRGMALDEAQTLAVPTYPTVSRWSSLQASVKIGGAAYKVDSCSFTGNNALRVHHQADAANPGQPTISEQGRRIYSGTLVGDYLSRAAYQRFVNGTEAALEILVSDGTHSFKLSNNVRFEGKTPMVAGEDVLKQELPFVCTGGVDDAAAFSAELVTPDTSL